MENLIRFLKVDIKIQKVLLILSCLGCLLIYFVALPLVVLGAWQIISAIVNWSKLRDRLRVKYLIFSFSYLVFMWLSIFYGEHFIGSDILTFFLYLVFVIFPIMIGFWYYGLTKRTLRGLTGGRIIEITRDEMENILDSDELLKTKI